ncbi:hypothetical protein K0M31_020290 [Melipona bicolor]|uniref:Uncharacterized protein n=1 Tax=Melipona bicolor TaxID=60889 RepID=A0AA40KQU1_9HYME|nr:hypothetical protein K0M31_020290 [Melipona bicolor]
MQRATLQRRGDELRPSRTVSEPLAPTTKRANHGPPGRIRQPRRGPFVTVCYRTRVQHLDRFQVLPITISEYSSGFGESSKHMRQFLTFGAFRYNVPRTSGTLTRTIRRGRALGIPLFSNSCAVAGRTLAEARVGGFSKDKEDEVILVMEPVRVCSAAPHARDPPRECFGA